MQALMNGNGMAGVIVSFARVITKAVLSDSGSRGSTIAFFSIFSGIMVLCAVGFFYLLKRPISIQSLKALSTASLPSSSSSFSSSEVELKTLPSIASSSQLHIQQEYPHKDVEEEQEGLEGG